MLHGGRLLMKMQMSSSSSSRRRRRRAAHAKLTGAESILFIAGHSVAKVLPDQGLGHSPAWQ